MYYFFLAGFYTFLFWELFTSQYLLKDGMSYEGPIYVVLLWGFILIFSTLKDILDELRLKRNW